MDRKKETRMQKEMASSHGYYKNMLNTHAFLRVSDRAIGEDLVQKTFMKTWLYLVKGGKIDLMKAFLYHILNHLIVDYYRKRKNVSLDVLLEKGFEPYNDPSKHLADVLDGKTAFLLVKQLQPKYQRVITMRYAQDLTLEEISKLTGQSKKTIAVQLFRGIKQLKLLYNPEKTK